MRIGMMTPWNANSGPSICAELIGREWVKNSHQLKVFAHDGSNHPDGIIVQEDEAYVERCFGTSYWGRRDWLDPKAILNSQLDVFAAQNLEILPMAELIKIYEDVRRNSKTVMVVHEGHLPEKPLFYEFDWDAVVCFDKRYKMFLSKAFPQGKIHIIPFPYHPIARGNKKTSRFALNLPLNRKIVFFFGYSAWRNLPLLPDLEEINRIYPMHILVLTTDEQSIRGFVVAAENSELSFELRREAPPLGRLYRYLHAADVLIKHVDDKSDVHKDNVTLSSTVHLCLGSGCPILVSDARIFETLDGQVLKYPTKDLDRFKAQLISIFDEKEILVSLRNAVERCIDKNSAPKIAEKYINLFNALK